MHNSWSGYAVQSKTPFQIEKKIKIGELEESKERKVNIYKWNIEQIDGIIEKAKGMQFVKFALSFLFLKI